MNSDLMMSTKIAITYEKGGCGKTTTAVNISAMLADKKYKTLLVDLDFQSYATSYYGLFDDNNPGIYEVMKSEKNPKDCILKTDIENLFLLPSKHELRNIETVLMMKTKRQEYTLQMALKEIEADYDFIIFDCPPSGERIKENALTYCDYVILPCIPDDYALHGLLCIAKEIVEIKQYTNPNLKIMGILICMMEQTKSKKAYAEALKAQDIFPCFETVIRKNTTLQEAINAHVPVHRYDKRSNGSKDYMALTEEIIKIAKEGK